MHAGFLRGQFIRVRAGQRAPHKRYMCVHLFCGWKGWGGGGRERGLEVHYTLIWGGRVVQRMATRGGGINGGDRERDLQSVSNPEGF